MFSCGLDKFSYHCVSRVVLPESFPAFPPLPRFSSLTHLPNAFLQLFLIRTYVIISMRSYLTTSHRYLLKGRIINMIFLAKALRLGCWTRIIRSLTQGTAVLWASEMPQG